MLENREIEVDFMTSVLGVEESSITTKYVTLGGVNTVTGNTFRILLLHPLDCLRSRFANINKRLGRTTCRCDKREPLSPS